jgi:predicted hydrolase (HD superfamily)
MDVPRDTLLRKALYAVDELTGLVAAVALVRPSKSILDVKVRSVRKKWKDRSFAAGVNRQDVEEGATALGVELSDHIGTVLAAMQGIAAELELDGRLASG